MGPIGSEWPGLGLASGLLTSAQHWPFCCSPSRLSPSWLVRLPAAWFHGHPSKSPTQPMNFQWSRIPHGRVQNLCPVPGAASRWLISCRSRCPSPGAPHSGHTGHSCLRPCSHTSDFLQLVPSPGLSSSCLLNAFSTLKGKRSVILPRKPSSYPEVHLSQPLILHRLSDGCPNHRPRPWAPLGQVRWPIHL